jgi:hypothetical protein
MNGLNVLDTIYEIDKKKSTSTPLTRTSPTIRRVAVVFVSSSS